MDKPAKKYSTRVLLVDDDTELCELVAELLQQNGMAVETCHDGISALARARQNDHDIMILDVQLPGQSGFEVLQALRPQSTLPVLMLTARGSEEDRFTGLESGADDYLPKPFHPRELIARLRAILRRTKSPEGSPMLPANHHVGDLEIHLSSRELRAHGKTLRCTGAEFDILACLMATPGRPIDRESLVRLALGRNYDPRDRSLDVHISHIRKNMQDGNVRRARIVTVRGAGYLISSVEDAR